MLNEVKPKQRILTKNVIFCIFSNAPYEGIYLPIIGNQDAFNKYGKEFKRKTAHTEKNKCNFMLKLVAAELPLVLV